MVKFRIGQSNDRAGQVGDVIVMRGGTAAHARTHAGVEFVEIRHAFGKLSCLGIPSAFFEKDRNRLGAQQPEAGIDKEEMIGGELGDFVRLGFLKKKCEFLRTGFRSEKNAEVRGGVGIHPHS